MRHYVTLRDMGKSAFIEDGRYYEVNVPDESIYVAAPIQAMPIGVLPTPAPPPAAPKPSTWPKVILVTLIVLIVAAAGALTFVLLRPATSSRTANQIGACREKVKTQLRAPATAQFSEEAVERQATGSYFDVHGLVDSQNGFGALVRNRYACTVTADGDALAASLSAWD